MKTPPTIIYTHGGGRLGNQVLRFAHWMAWVLEQNDEVEVRDLAFWPYAHLFEAWRRHPGCVFPVRPDVWDEAARALQPLPEWIRHRTDWRIQRWVHSVVAAYPDWRSLTLDTRNREQLSLETTVLRDRIDRFRVTAIAGWRIAGWKLVEKHAAVLREYFRPERAFAKQAESFIGDLRRRHGFIIGVLMRQEDYRVWLDGRFYHTSAEYVDWIQQALALYDELRPAVVVAAAEWPGKALFGRLPVYPSTGNKGEGGHWFEQWAQLSQCDLILSVPSTFAATAAFAGNIPLWPISRAHRLLAKSQIIPDNMIGAARHHEFSIAVN